MSCNMRWMHVVRTCAHIWAGKRIPLRSSVNLFFALQPWFASWYCIKSAVFVSIWIPSVVLSDMMECTCKHGAPPEMKDCQCINKKQSSLEAYGIMLRAFPQAADPGSFSKKHYGKSYTTWHCHQPPHGGKCWAVLKWQTQIQFKLSFWLIL